ncbi:hypothetical protein [Aliiroseovarius sp. F47248L]|uniref:hypothetical protein n=1 Tax=Aliiroseovarius sp. F47248L TaxID=2926420 RepID=UPI001FF66F49|nr:hypothetical protein [Aliiroseovarius sp. F47248L]MCK0139615.1 hypothetical protein [Aliiroseovarius sp. F47248L]
MSMTVTWTGHSGSRYRFDVFPVGTPFNPISGVYIFCRQIASGSWEALYVGETQSLEQRLNTGIGSHQGYARAARFGMTHIAAIAVAGDAESLRIETDLRYGLNPSANAQNALGGFANEQ